MKLSFLLGTLAFLLGVHSAQSAGISTHIEVADRAALEVDAGAYAELSGVVQAWPVALRSGSIYPDWGYLLEEYSAAAEDAHWGPFRKLAMDYHRTAYPQPWSSLHAERVLAFFMGIGVHGRTDDVWHFGNNAFLPEAMANDLVDVDPEQAELVIEVLVDFFTQQDHRPNSEKTRLWVPLNDILAVHESAGHLNLSRQAIFLGTSAQSVAYFLEDLLWPYIAPLGALITLVAGELPRLAQRRRRRFRVPIRAGHGAAVGSPDVRHHTVVRRPSVAAPATGETSAQQPEAFIHRQGPLGIRRNRS